MKGLMMTNSMPWMLVITWSFFFGFVNTHQRHLAHSKGSSRKYHLLFQISVVLGSIIGLSLLVYYFLNVAWYWSTILVVVGYLLAGVVFGVLDDIIGEVGINMLSFVGWPIFAEWTYLTINGMVKY
jgi:hypothetical protein